jgi:hypothetical protein
MERKSILHLRIAMAGQDNTQKQTPRDAGREERLAAKLRENLRRRKAQARAMDDTDTPQES